MSKLKYKSSSNCEGNTLLCTWLLLGYSWSGVVLDKDKQELERAAVRTIAQVRHEASAAVEAAQEQARRAVAAASASPGGLRSASGGGSAFTFIQNEAGGGRGEAAAETP